MLNTDSFSLTTMAHYRRIGWCLLGLSLLANLAMAHHPHLTQPDPHAQIEQMAKIAPLTAYVHGLLILVVLSYVWLFACYGAVKNTPVVWLGSGLFAVGGLAMAGAGLISGFLAPTLMLGTEIDTTEQLAIFEFQSRLMWHSNQILAQAGSVLWLCALLCWSSNLLHDNKVARGVGLAGLLIGIASLIGIITGQWHLHVKGMGLLVLAITLWFCALAGYLLWSVRKQ